MNIDITLTPSGWKLVPQVPTEEMMSAGLYQSNRGADYHDVCQAYMDMVKVAPEPPHDYETASVVNQRDSRDTYIDALAEEKTCLAAELAHLRRSAAVLDVARERSRQVEEEGWTPSHDDAHQDRSLALAAACYAMFASVSDEARASTEMPASLTVTGEAIPGWSAWLEIWPWERRFWKPADRRRDLVKAASLIVAEIERLDRAAASEEELDSPSDRSAPSIGALHGSVGLATEQGSQTMKPSTSDDESTWEPLNAKSTSEIGKPIAASAEYVSLEDAKAAAQADYSARIISAIVVPPAEGGIWQPIETAPKDGRTIIVAAYCDDENVSEVGCAYWPEANEWFWWHNQDYPLSENGFEARYWKPLPLAPSIRHHTKEDGDAA